MLAKILCFAVFATARAVESKQPMYKYRYETEDVMKTAESGTPLRGYHVVQGEYYPSDAAGAESISTIGGVGSIGGVGRFNSFGGAGFGGGAGYSGLGYGGIGPGVGFGGGYGPGLIHRGPIGGFGGGYGGGGYSQGGFYPGYSQGYIPVGHHHHHGIGGEAFDKKSFADEHKNVDNGHYQKAGGKKGEVVDHGSSGYSKGGVVLKNDKGDSGYYNDQSGGKKVFEDGKQYSGGQHYDQEGKNGQEKKENKNHKKGHVIKGFKTSHHKDESGKTEEFYDEEHDEGGHTNFNGQSGSFGEKAQSSFKGGHEDGKFNVGSSKKEGKYDNVHAVDKSNADEGSYGEKKFGQSGQTYGSNNGIDESSLLGHQESSRAFKHYPYHVPIFGY